MCIYFVLWCNGSTTDSGPVCLGSNPSRTTQKPLIIFNDNGRLYFLCDNIKLHKKQGTHLNDTLPILSS